MNLKLGNWKKFLFKASIVSATIILANLLIVYLFGSTIWLYASYFFGNNAKTTLSTLLFIEGAATLALGFVWLSGAMEVNFDGSNIKTNIYNRRNNGSNVQTSWNRRSQQERL